MKRSEGFQKTSLQQGLPGKDFLDEHPGGPDVVTALAGKDCPQLKATRLAQVAQTYHKMSACGVQRTG